MNEKNATDVQNLKELAYNVAHNENYTMSVRTDAMKALALLAIAEKLNANKTEEVM